MQNELLTSYKKVDENISNKLYKFFKFSKSIEPIWNNVLNDLVYFSEGTLEQVKNMGILKQLAQLFRFSINFDTIKVKYPGIQTDLWYFRRYLHQFKEHLTKSKKTNERKVNDETANLLTFAFSYQNPMMKQLIDLTRNQSNNISNLNGALAYTIHVCLDNLTKNRNGYGEENISLLLSLMTGCIILLDVLDYNTFNSKSIIKILPVIKILIDLGNNSDENKDLINALKFTTSLSARNNLTNDGDFVFKKLRKLLFQ